MYHGSLTNGSLIGSFTKDNNRGTVFPRLNSTDVRKAFTCKCGDVQTTSIYIRRLHFGCRGDV